MPDAAEKVTIIFYSARFVKFSIPIRRYRGLLHNLLCELYRYHPEFHSIFPVGDLTALIPDELADVCVLEEPEHLNWYAAPPSNEVLEA